MKELNKVKINIWRTSFYHRIGIATKKKPGKLWGMIVTLTIHKTWKSGAKSE